MSIRLPQKPPLPFSVARLREEARAYGSNYLTDLAARGSPYLSDVAARGLPFSDLIAAGPEKWARVLARLREDAAAYGRTGR